MRILDTHKEVKALVAVGMSEEQAERVVDLMERRNKILATKDDLRNLYDNVQKDIDSVKKDIDTLRKDIYRELEYLRNDFQRNFTWIKAIAFLAIGLLVKIAFFQ